MSRETVDQFFDEFKERFRQLVRETVAEELEPIRGLLLKPVGEEATDVAELVDAVEIARLLGEDISTERKRRAAAQKVYDLARRELIPSVRVSPRRIRFNPQAVKKCFAEGGRATPFSTAGAPAASGAALRT